MDAPGTFKANIKPPSLREQLPWTKAALVPVSREPLRRAKKARERHRMVVYLHCAGWTNNDIARAMEYTPARVSIIINSQNPELLEVKKQAQALVMDATTDVMLKFRQESMKSVETLVKIRDIDSEDHKVIGQRRLAARDILDRAGYSVVHKQLNFNSEVPLPQLQAAMEKIDEANEVDARRHEWRISNPQEIEVKRATA